MIRRVHEEGILLLGGGRALLMQIAHPAVARGVAEHSSFRSERTARLLRTLRPVYAIAFGTPAQATTAAASINRVHAAVNGPAYRATDPALLTWVLATLIDTALVLHERFVRPLDSVEAEAYYSDMARLGSLLGLPESFLPADVAAFRPYVEEMVATLEVTDEARAIARELFRPAVGIGLITPAMKPLTAGLLPPRLRREYGLDWGAKREQALRRAGRASRTLLPLIPKRLRAPPWFIMPPKSP